MTDFLYDYPTFMIVSALFAAIMVFIEFGFRSGRYIQTRTNTEVKSLAGSIQGSVLGLLALLLGFTFAMSMQRYDARSMAVIDEANAIGTAVLRIDLLPLELQPKVHEVMAEYVDLRVKLSTIDMTETDTRKTYLALTTQIHNRLWSLATIATQLDSRPTTSGAFMTSLNQVIDAQGKRNALLQMRVPEVVLYLLFTVFVTSGAMLGYSAGLSGSRIPVQGTLMALLISLIVFIIVDLDRPKRGFIQVNQQVLVELKR
jgi:hypothetical protein